ncbi:hypothetical protein V865_001753 [Kwoniella europaea PYCC6329]|uniref:Uncharacterized protein n=1 Tax=Kwoniella europaea PYCC6329 TaxID=1423913 RepID=A0AAX4KDA8_9TREE
MSRYDVEDVNGCHIRAQPMTDWEWGLEYECSEGLNYNVINFVTDDYEDHWDYLVRFLKKLKTLDIVMIFTIKDRRPSPDEYSKEIRCSDLHNGPNKAHQKIQEYESKLRSAMSKAAIPFLEHIPSLETGYFWEPYGPLKPTGWMDIEEWYRWEYRRVIHNDGSWGVEMMPTPQHLSSDFIANPDGMEH